jgi:ribose/xylose/arabinose/galactoside ABC-type transport system permease subunit
VDWALLGGFLLLVAGFSLAQPAFLTVDNFKNIALASSITAVITVPSALLILSGYIDLSVGSNLAFGAMTSGMLMVAGVPPWLACLGGIGASTAVGVLNGALTCAWGLSPIIVTLGTLTFVRGLALAIQPTTVFGFPPEFLALGVDGIFGVPYLVLIAAGMFLAGWFVLEHTAYGRHIQGIGVNREAAFLSGVSVRALPFALFAVTGAAVGLAAAMYTARIASVTPGLSGTGIELDVLTAVLLGGVAFGGGRGGMGGVLLGVLTLGVLQNGLTLVNAPTAVALMAKGLALGIAAVLHVAGQRLASR